MLPVLWKLMLELLRGQDVGGTGRMKDWALRPGIYEDMRSFGD